MTTRLSILTGAIALVVLLPLHASAQVFGVFTWQMQPYCNRITLTLKNTTAGFTLDGTDDQCGVSRGSAYGVATFTPTGTVALNFTIVPAPGGKAIHVSAIVDPGNGSGSWTDSAGRTGMFALGAATGGATRPDPTSALAAGSVTSTELADGAVTGAKVNSAQVQLRVSGTCPAGEQVVAVNANGTVQCGTTTPGAGSIGTSQLADGGVTAAKLASGAVTSAKVDSAQVQLRVSGSCSAGQLMVGVNANGTVLCAAPTTPAASLECTNTSVSSFTISANTTNFFNNPACPSGYTAVTPYCWTATPGVYNQGSGYNANAPGNSTFCSWQNSTGSSQTVFGGNVCCRVPAQ